MANINRKKALESINKNFKTITVKKWDIEVLIKGLSLGERLHAPNLLQQLTNKERDDKITKEFVKIAIKNIYDTETKEQLFNEADMDLLIQDDTGAIDMILSEIFKLSGIFQGIEDEIEKN